MLVGLAGLTAVAVAVGVPTGRAARKPDRSAVPRLGKIVLIVFENRDSEDVVGNPAAPFFGELARRYAELTDYDAIDHPSLPNYLALISGSTHGIENDCARCVIDAPNLVDELGAAGKSWKAYFEGLPHPGFTGKWGHRYSKAVNPFVHFRDIVSSPSRLARVVPLTAFRDDLAERNLPDFSFVAPNLCHDMHSCSVRTGDEWLRDFLPPLLASPQFERGTVFVVFDEGRRDDIAGGGGLVPALALGEPVRVGADSSKPFDHYSLLRTIEDAWSLPPLGDSAETQPITGIWRGASAASGPGRNRTSARGFEVRRSIH
jgi:phosphatidylinositol-3-phosphatase